MQQLNSYLSRTIFFSVMLVLFVILFLNSVSTLLGERSDLEGNYTFVESLKYVLLSIPGSLFELLPFATLIGCLAGLGTLANNSELVIIRSTGVSTLRIIWMVMRPALFVMIIGMLIGEYIAPKTQSMAQSHKAIALQSTNVVSKQGLWHRERDKFMHFNAVQPNGVLYGVTIYEFKDTKELASSLYAERAIYQGDYWLLEDLSYSKVGDDRIEQRQLSSMRWEVELSPELLNILVLNPEDLPMSGLWSYANYLSGQGLNNSQYMLAFWDKVFQPLSIIALVLVAISFVFGPLRQVTMGFRIFIGVIIGIVFQTTQDVLGPASIVYGFTPIYASLIPALVCGGIGIYLLQRTR